MRAVRSFVMIMCLVSILVTTSYGAEEQFTIDALVGSDTTPPSVPSSLVATPVATTQINLSWASSTDNYLVAGYHVWRDSVHIATSTVAAYADTGLTASTTYSYYVTAFDPAFNISASSSVVSTTTLSITPTSTPTATTSSFIGRIFGSRAPSIADMLERIIVTPATDSAQIDFETDGYLRSIVRWGITPEYEMGSLRTSEFKERTMITIQGLAPSTRYYYHIEGETGRGKTGILHTGSFVTMAAVDIFAPGNVSYLRAVERDGRVVLTWENPADVDFSKVRVVRNDRGYPADYLDGRVLYDGAGESYIDTWDMRTQYYSVFTYDTAGNISSGAVVRVRADFGISTQDEPEIDETINPIHLSFNDVLFYQDGVLLETGGDAEISIDGTKQLFIALPYDMVPEHLKTIIVTFTDPADTTQQFSFLLRINREKTAYTAAIAPFGYARTYPVTITVFDYETQQIGFAKGVVVSVVTSASTPQTMESFLMAVLGLLSQSYIVWTMLLFALFVLIGRRLMHGTEHTPQYTQQ